MEHVTFEPLDGGTGVEIVDPIQRHRYALSTPTPVTPRSSDSDRFLFPVDAAVELRTDRIELPDAPCVYVRDDDGSMVTSTEPPSRRQLPDADYYVEICAPIKLYLRVSAPVTVEATMDAKTIRFGSETAVEVGARSKHEHPAGTVTTTADPEDVMAAVSTFGSALKTTSPERSFPTLRGHPPTVELDERLRIPDGLTPPDTGVRIEVPRDLRHVYVVSPLAFYLGATVTPRRTPRIVTDRGFTYDLGPDVERAAERVLKATFLLDCVTRTEGLYDLPLAERRAIEPSVDLDFAVLYDRPLADRLEAYLGVPYDVLEPHVPEWKLTTHVDVSPTTVETLPFVVDDLAVVRTDAGRGPDGTGGLATDSTTEAAHEAAVDTFVRDGTFTRGQRSASAASQRVEPTVASGTAGSMEQTWIGDGAPFGASKATPEAFRNRLDRTPDGGDVPVTVVCNDERMVEEREHLDDVYGSRESVPFEVRTHEQLTVAELRDVLASDAAFLHYIGHVDEDGFECVDGSLDAAEIEATGVEAFLLNACNSYRQGMALIEAGAVGGIVTLEEVVNAGAVDVGYTLARLLNNGFPLAPAMDLAREGSYIGQQYLVVGDGGFAFVQDEGSNLPHLCELQPTEEGFELTMDVYTPSRSGIGGIFQPYLPEAEEFHLNSGSVGPFEVTKEDLREFLSSENAPVRANGELHWSAELDPDSL
ncbi:hypothetical protein BRC81_15865 [Halobacteriales archaeon QS_1_68_20]|nr:MAG: hypothetical protein BRC81_15865 [Halobacteriales archaeon QS_1_68_20]